AADHYRLDVEVVQGSGKPVEQHTIVGDDLFGLVLHAVAALWVAAAQVARGQHGLHTGVPEHGLSGQTHLREQAFGAATREVEDRFRLGGGCLGVTNDGDVARVF